MKRRFTVEQRTEAVDLALKVGTSAAAHQLDIPAGTVATWVHRAGHVGGERAEQVRPAVEARQAVTAERKAQLAADLSRLSAKACAKLIERIDNDSIGSRELVTALTAAVDRLQLLTGEATSRPELMGGAEPAQRGQLVSVVEQLRERAAS